MCGVGERGGREEGRKEGGREGWREGGRDGGREGGREGDSEGESERGREGKREGGRDGGRVEVRRWSKQPTQSSKVVSALQTGFNAHSMRIHGSGLNPLPIHFNRIRTIVLPCEFDTV